MVGEFKLSQDQEGALGGLPEVVDYVQVQQEEAGLCKNNPVAEAGKFFKKSEDQAGAQVGLPEVVNFV